MSATEEEEEEFPWMEDGAALPFGGLGYYGGDDRSHSCVCSLKT